MRQYKKIVLASACATLVLVIILTGCQGIVSSSPTPVTAHNVNHIIFMMQENRSFDAYFGKLNDYRAAAFGQARNTDDLEATFTNPADDGAVVSSFHLATSCIFDDTASCQERWDAINRFASVNDPLLPVVFDDTS